MRKAPPLPTYLIFGNDSDVSVFVREDETLVCAPCSISATGGYSTTDWDLMVMHLYMHERVGDRVPEKLHRWEEISSE